MGIIDGLTDTLREMSMPFSVVSVVLAGSFARGNADEGSDIDVLVLTDADQSYVQCGVWQDRYIEVDYLPVRAAGRGAVRRATLAGAKILYDPDGVARAWLDEIGTQWLEPYPISPAERAYGRWDLAQSLRTLRTLEEQKQGLALLYLRNLFVQELVEYALKNAGVWVPSPRRQLQALATADPDALHLVAEALAAKEPVALVAACEAAYRKLVGMDMPSWAVAPILPWP